MRGRILFVCIFLFCASLAYAEDIPAEWKEYLDLDRNYNVFRRRPLDKESQAVIPIYTVEVPIEWVSEYRSKYLDKETEQEIIVEKNKRKYVKIFFRNTKDSPYEAFRKMKLPIKHSHWGTKLQSHSTYFVWNKDDNSKTPLFLKLQASTPNGPFNTSAHAQNAVLINDVVEEYLSQTESSEGAVLPERYGIHSTVAGYDYAYSVRSVKPSREEANSKLLPAHGVLGNVELMSELAKKRNLKGHREWIELEYLPKLARFSAHSQFMNGVYFEGHTQNLLFQVDRTTGELKGIVTRDMNDVLFDHFPLVAQGLYPPDRSPLESGISAIFKTFIAREEAKEPGAHMALYDHQGIMGLTGETIARARHAAIYLKEFIKATKEFTGLAIELPNRVEKQLVSLEDSIKWQDPLAAEYGLQALVSVTKELQSQITILRVKELKDPMPASQESMAALYREKFSEGNLALFNEKSLETLRREPLEYLFLGGGILVREKKNGNPLAMAFGLSKSEKASLEESGNWWRALKDFCFPARRAPSQEGFAPF